MPHAYVLRLVVVLRMGVMSRSLKDTFLTMLLLDRGWCPVLYLVPQGDWCPVLYRVPQGGCGPVLYRVPQGFTVELKPVASRHSDL